MSIQILRYGSEVFRYPKADRQTLCAAYKRLLQRDSIRTILVGDWARFSNGLLRISHVWRNEQGVPEGIQTSSGGTYYLCDGGGMSMSGSLNHSIPFDGFILTNERIMGTCWMFYNESGGAHRGVDMMIPIKVWSINDTVPLY